jgi:mRNA interferase HigB
MRVISNRKLRGFCEDHPDAERPLQAWYRVARHADWSSFADVRAIYSHADQVGRFTVFNIGGNKYRLIVDIHFNRSIIFIHRVLTHKEYDAGDWKGG